MPWGGEIVTFVVPILVFFTSLTILSVSIYYNRKALATSTKILKESEQRSRDASYLEMKSIVKKSDKGYDSFPELCMFFDSYQGVWVDDKIKKSVDVISGEMKEFAKQDPMQEPEPEQPSDEEIEKRLQEDQEEIDRLTPEERYMHDHNQKFGNVKKDLLELIDRTQNNTDSQKIHR